jgi:predicted DNA-binding protein YlxM (UPF0122 family)
MAKNLEFSNLLDFYGNMLTQNQQEVIKYYYNNDFSLAEIAHNSGISRQGVRDSIKKAEAQLLEMEQKLGLLKKFRTKTQKVQQIFELCKQIKDVSRECGFSEQMNDYADEIERTVDQLVE